MFYLHNLKDHLIDRRNRLCKTGYRTYDAELRYLLQFLHENTYTRTLLDILDASTVVDFAQWESEQSHRGIDFPATEEGRAKVCYQILKLCANDETDRHWSRWGWAVSSEKRLDDIFRDMTDSIVDPLVYFLLDQIDEAGNVLYLIERFKLKAEWFRRESLYSLYVSDTSVGEKNLDRELRSGLFDGGIDYPFSQPSSPSGEADIVALLGSDDPLVLEVKIFDPANSKTKGHLQQGFHQVLRYSDDYNQSVGYLVIFNCSDKQLIISPGDAVEPETPCRIPYGGKTFFVIPIDIHSDAASASKEKPASRQTVNYRELTGEQ